MARRGQVLVAIMNDPLDMAIARDQHWYRIPVSSVDKWLADCWPPRWLAFYQTKVFGDEAYAVRYYTRVIEVRRAYRYELLPDQPRDRRSRRRYYQLILEPLRRLEPPILSRRLRRIVFISTTWDKLTHAVEINDLYDESPLEDRLWAAMKRWQIPAERQEFVQVADRSYALDFAIYCAGGKIYVETRSACRKTTCGKTTWRRRAGPRCALTRRRSTSRWRSTVCRASSRTSTSWAGRKRGGWRGGALTWTRRAGCNNCCLMTCR